MSQNEYKDKMSTHLKETRERLSKVPGVHSNDLITIDNAISWVSIIENRKPVVAFSRYQPMPREVI